MGAVYTCCCAQEVDKKIEEEEKHHKTEKKKDAPKEARKAAPADDAAAFDQAFKEQNLPGLVKLMDSTEKIQAEEQMHQWAKNPETIGCLAGTQLAIKASIGPKTQGKTPYDSLVKDKIRESGAIPKFVEFLNSGEEDRVHNAVVALSFLCIENPKNATEAYRNGALKPLIPLMLSRIEGLACAAASICRNIVVDDEDGAGGEKRKDEFVTLGGVEGLVALLDVPPNARSLHEMDQKRMLDLKLEALLTICEFMEDSYDDKKIIPRYAKQLAHFGIRKKLKVLFEFDDREVLDVGEDLLASLDEVGA